MNNQRKWWWTFVSLSLSIVLTTYVSGHEGGSGSSKNLVRVALAPNPSVPEFANAKGSLALDLYQRHHSS